MSRAVYSIICKKNVYCEAESTCGCLASYISRLIDSTAVSIARSILTVTDGRSPIMSCNDFSRVAASYLLGRCRSHAPHHMASSAKPSSCSCSTALPQWRRLRRQNALTRAPVKLSDKLVRERRVSYSGPPLRIGIQQRVAAIIGLLAPEWAAQPANGQQQCYKKAKFGRFACRHA